MRNPAARGRKDANQGSIVRTLKACGCRVIDLSRVGGGCGDLLVYVPRLQRLELLEVKTEGGHLTPKQEGKVADRWPIKVVRTDLEALAAVGVQAEWEWT